MRKRIDIAALTPVVGTLYPPPFDAPCRARGRTKLGDPAELTQFGVNLLRLPPGAWSSQRHWHTAGDEFVYVLSGEVVLVSDGGEEVLHAGDAAGFPANDSNGHCLQNRSAAEAQVLEVGTRVAGDIAYRPLEGRAEAASLTAEHLALAGDQLLEVAHIFVIHERGTWTAFFRAKTAAVFAILTELLPHHTVYLALACDCSVAISEISEELD